MAGDADPPFFEKIDFLQFPVHLVHFGMLQTVIIMCASIEWMTGGSIIDK